MGHTAGADAVFEGQWATTAGKKIVKWSNTPVASDNSDTPLGKKTGHICTGQSLMKYAAHKRNGIELLENCR